MIFDSTRRHITWCQEADFLRDLKILTKQWPFSTRKHQRSMILKMNQVMYGDFQRYQASPGMRCKTARLHKTAVQEVDFFKNLRIPTKFKMNQVTYGDIPRYQELPAMRFKTARRHKTSFQEVDYLRNLKSLTKSWMMLNISGRIQNLGWT